jgi:hypothetical protein
MYGMPQLSTLEGLLSGASQQPAKTLEFQHCGEMFAEIWT